ncbi:MAG: hypothetical protein M0T80_13235 [Actinomycetota bacterium]|nr:hypothetical protein [Actinomycetota bacterium]
MLGVGAALSAGALLCACGSRPAPPVDAAASSRPSAPADPLALATSLQAAGGTWAVVPMGRLDQPVNTFWQLMYLPAGSGRWSDRVEATATATNGGLLVAGSGDFLAVGILPSTLLRFSPMIATDDAGRSWSDGLVDSGIDAHAASLAVESPGAGLALTDSSRSGRILEAAGGLSRWRTLLTAGTLGRSPAGASCRPAELTTVGYLAGHPVVGASCSSVGELGLFVDAAGSWRSVPVDLASSVGGDRLEVLWYGGAPGHPEALVEASSRSGAHSDLLALAAEGSGHGFGHWRTSTTLPLAAGWSVGSVSALSGGVLGVLVGDGVAREDVETVAPGGTWRSGPAAPAGSETLAQAGSGTVDALAGSGSTLAVWSLGPSARSWRLTQRLHVAIQYGSSS